MNSRRSIVIAGIVALVVLCVICLLKHLGPITRQTQAANLGSAGPTFFLNAERDVVVLRGNLPDEGLRNILHSLTGASFDPRIVVDSMVVIRGLAEAPWRQAALTLLPSLIRLVTNPRVEFRSHTATITGTVRSAYHKEQLQESLASAEPAVLLIDSMTVIPAEEMLVPIRSIEAILGRNTIEFSEGTAALTGKGKATLDKLLPFFQEFRETIIEIGGHTDSQGDPDGDMQLSCDRAESVKRYLVQNGVNGALLETRGYGSTSPLVDGDTPRARQRNRRIEFSLR